VGAVGGVSVRCARHESGFVGDTHAVVVVIPQDTTNIARNGLVT
jgi:hypothetical protein